MFMVTSTPELDEALDLGRRIALAGLLAVGDEDDDLGALVGRQVVAHGMERGAQRRARLAVERQLGDDPVHGRPLERPEGHGEDGLAGTVAGLEGAQRHGQALGQRLVDEAGEDLAGDGHAGHPRDLLVHAARGVEDELDRDAAADGHRGALRPG